MKSLFSVIASLSLLLLIGCSNNQTDAETTIRTNILNCSATVMSVNNSTASLNAFLSVAGGDSPYQINAVTLGGTVGVSQTTLTNFNSSSNIYYEFSGLSSLAGRTGLVSVMDSSGSVATCELSVLGAAESALSCVTVASNDTPNKNESVDLTFDASGGVAPYTFSSFEVGSTGEIQADITSTSDDSAAAEVRYASQGTKLVTAVVTDSNGIQGNCALNLEVLDVAGGGKGLSCTAKSNPTTSQAGDSVVVSAIAYSYVVTTAQLVEIEYPTNSGIFGFFTSSYKASVTFPTSGSFPLVLHVEDVDGERTSCVTTHYVTP